MPVKNEEEAYEKIIDMNKIMTIKLVIYWILVVLKKIIKDPQQINFIGKLENQDHEATMFFIIEKSEETTFNILQNSVTII